MQTADATGLCEIMSTVEVIKAGERPSWAEMNGTLKTSFILHVRKYNFQEISGKQKILVLKAAKIEENFNSFTVLQSCLFSLFLNFWHLICTSNAILQANDLHATLFSKWRNMYRDIMFVMYEIWKNMLPRKWYFWFDNYKKSKTCCCGGS